MRPGDLTALAAVGNGVKIESERVERLTRRGFLSARNRSDEPAVTMLGRVALVIKRFTSP